MFYKVIKDNKVIDVLDKVTYLKWQPRHKIMVLTDETDAQAILSSDGNIIWHEKTLYRVPVDEPKFDTVELVEIDRYEHEKLRTLNLKTPEEIIDSVIMELLSKGVI